MELIHRETYPDICKFVAIFLVTCSHCAQAISGEIWTNFLGGSEIDIAFNMPLFMIMSGWFLNFNKLRSNSFFQYAWSKFKRLIIPALTWYVIYCILTAQLFSVKHAITFCWYLKTLFACLIIIFIFAKLIKNNALSIVLSTAFVLLCPFAHLGYINFMFPFLWTGYLLRQLFDRGSKQVLFTAVILSLVLSFFLSFFWTSDYSVYVCPLNILQVTSYMISTYVYRFVIGVCFSVVIIYIAKVSQHTKYAKFLAKYGQYTLVIYTSSCVICGMLSRLLNLLNVHTNAYIIIDLLSIIMCLIIVSITVIMSNKAKKNQLTSLLLLGE